MPLQCMLCRRSVRDVHPVTCDTVSMRWLRLQYYACGCGSAQALELRFLSKLGRVSKSRGKHVGAIT